MEVSPCTSDDLSTIVSIYFAAFQNPLALAAFPDIPSVRKWWTDMLRDELSDPSALFLKVVHKTGHLENSELIAWAKWNKPSTKADSEEALPAWPAGGDADLSNEFFGQMAQKHKSIMANPHWYLECVATSPAHQGRGAASLLLSHVLDEADKGGYEAYLESSPEGVRLYQKFGFTEKDKIELTVKQEPYINLCMVREPTRKYES